MEGVIFANKIKKLSKNKTVVFKIQFEYILALLIFYYDNYLRIKNNIIFLGLSFNSSILLFDPYEANKKEQLSEIYNFLDKNFYKKTNKTVDLSLLFGNHIINIAITKKYSYALTIKVSDYQGKSIKSFISFSKVFCSRLCFLEKINGKKNNLEMVQNKARIVYSHVFSFIQYLFFLDLLKSKRLDNDLMTKNIIERTSDCLIPLAEYYSVKFYYKNIDLKLNFDMVVFSRLIFDIAYQAIINSRRESFVNVLSYIENERFCVEFNINTQSKEMPTFSFPRYLNKILSDTNSELAYKLNSKGETLFVLSIPYGNIRS